VKTEYTKMIGMRDARCGMRGNSLFTFFPALFVMREKE